MAPAARLAVHILDLGGLLLQKVVLIARNAPVDKVGEGAAHGKHQKHGARRKGKHKQNDGPRFHKRPSPF